MAAPTPIGAKYMMSLVKPNIVSARLSANASIGRRRASGTMASAMPKNTLNTTTCRTWPSATDRATLSGKMSSTTSAQVRSGAAGKAPDSTAAGRATPTPAWLIVMAIHPMARASVVTTSK